MEELPDWCKGENWCPVTATASTLSGKWHPIIIHRLIKYESMGFNEIKDELEVSSKVLSENLTNLQEKKPNQKRNSTKTTQKSRILPNRKRRKS